MLDFMFLHLALLDAGAKLGILFYFSAITEKYLFI